MKTVFTTGEAAEICKVSQQTIIRCFDSGRLKGFRVPGSRFRRIPREALVQFMKDNGIPPDSLDINGNVVCATIRKNPNFQHIKIIIVSGVVNQDEINELLKAGADEFVKKPFNIEKLIERVGELLAV